MTFCYSPWSNIDISPQGTISPCCKFRHEYYTEPLNIQNSSLDDYLTSPTLREIRQDFAQGTWPRGCERCRIEEENAIESKRQLDYARWQKQYQEYDQESDGLLTASIAFGNTCNLKCITCNPEISSFWHKEYLEIYGKDVRPIHFYKSSLIDQLANHMPHIMHIDIPGGEPFLSGVKEQKKLLKQLIASGRSQEISLHYTTNVTIFPDPEWWELWQQFRNVDLQLSIDGVGQRFEYIRHPASWSLVQVHIKKYLARQGGNIQISVSHTVSAFNIFYLDEFFTWCNETGLPRPWLGRVHSPVHLRPSVWPKAIANKIVAHLKKSKYQDVLTWAELLNNTDDSQHFETFRQSVMLHSDYRKQNLDLVFPELVQWLR